jgi:hypothetical protein
MELLFAIEDEFNLKVPNDSQNLKTVGDVVALIDALQQSQLPGAGAARDMGNGSLANPAGQQESNMAARRAP